jgi:hypothetical protein
MTSDNPRERKEKRHFTVVLISGTDSRETRTFSTSVWRVIGIVISVLVILSALITAVIVYTPIGARLPISNPKLEFEYGKQILDIQERMGFLLRQLNEIRGYNLRLRRAMGEEISEPDSGLIAGGTIDTTLDPDGIIAEWGRPTGNEAATMAGSPPSGGPAGGIPGRSYSVPAVTGERAASEFPLSSPADGFLTREFSPAEFHYGIDYASKEGNPVWAAAPGRVVFSGWTSDDGYMLMVSHSLGYMTIYKHNRTLLKAVGDEVRRGEMIAMVGNTGKSSGPHLHFELWKDGIAMNAVHYLLTTP